MYAYPEAMRSDTLASVAPSLQVMLQAILTDDSSAAFTAPATVKTW